MRIIILAFGATLVAMGSAALAESARLTALFPAGNPQIAKFKTLGIDEFSGREGSKLALELERRLTKPFDGNAAYFILLADGSAPDGVVRGNASSAVTEAPYERTDQVCVAKGPDGKCTAKAPQVFNCIRRIVEFSGDISVVDNTSGQIIFSQQFPRREEVSWCGSQQAPTTISQVIQNFTVDVAKQFSKIATPYVDDYTVRYMENIREMDAPTKASFKTAIKLTEKDPMGACRLFDTLGEANPNNPSVVFNQGVCAEIQHDYLLAKIHYGKAAELSGNRGDAAKGLERVQKMQSAKELAEKRG